MQKKIEKLLEISNNLYSIFNEEEIFQRKCINLGKMECSLLQDLHKSNKPICMNELSTHLNISHSRVTRIIDNLIKKKLVTRYPSKEDRRRWYAKILTEGEKLANVANSQKKQLQENIFNNLPEDQVDSIINHLELYIDSFKKSLKKIEENSL